MHFENMKNDFTLMYFNVFCDVELILRLPCFLPLLECMHIPSRLHIDKMSFMCDFVDAMKLTQHELCRFSCDPFAKFENPTFDNFNANGTLTN